MSKSNRWQTFAIGVGAYYLLSFLVSFYPALVVAVDITCKTDSNFPPFPEFYGVVFFFITYFLLKWMITCRVWVVLVLSYLITLWPFIQIVKWVYQENSDIPFPGIDWIPW